MTAMKKGTKLTDNPKDYMLRVRMDKETLAKLNSLSEKFNMSKSSIIRDCIGKLYSETKK